MIKIIGGKKKGWRIQVPLSKSTRPTSSRVREAIASALHSRTSIKDATILDLFAGTGAMAMEMLSRGAKHAALVERDKKAISNIKKNLTRLNMHQNATVLCLDAMLQKSFFKLSTIGPFDIVFIDPPYDAAKEAHSHFFSCKNNTLSHDAMIVFEYHHKIQPSTITNDAFHPLSSYRYGNTCVDLIVYRKQ